MKHRSLLTVLLLAAVFCLKAESPSVLVYHMPKTLLQLDVHYTVSCEEQGIFYQYSQRYLGTDQAITANGTSYRLDKISLRPKTIADTARSYAIDLTAYPITSLLLSLDHNGVLSGINISQPQATPQGNLQEPPHPKKVVDKQKTAITLPPYMEEQLIAGSVAKMAEMTAKQIYRIRETRLNILAGDVDHVPADGEAMKLVLKELRKQEESLTALFMGRRTIRHMHQTITIDPSTDLHHSILFRFSQFAGIVAADDLSGEPVFVEVKLQPVHIDSSIYESPKKPTELSPIYFNQPAHATVKLFYQNQILADEVFPVAQAGVAQPLPQSWFSRPSDTHIWFDTQTGAIKQIAK